MLVADAPHRPVCVPRGAGLRRRSCRLPGTRTRQLRSLRQRRERRHPLKGARMSPGGHFCISFAVCVHRRRTCRCGMWLTSGLFVLNCNFACHTRLKSHVHSTIPRLGASPQSTLWRMLSQHSTIPSCHFYNLCTDTAQSPGLHGYEGVQESALY